MGAARTATPRHYPRQRIHVSMRYFLWLAAEELRPNTAPHPGHSGMLSKVQIMPRSSCLVALLGNWCRCAMAEKGIVHTPAAARSAVRSTHEILNSSSSPRISIARSRDSRLVLHERESITSLARSLSKLFQPASLAGDCWSSSAISCALISWLIQAKIDNASLSHSVARLRDAA